SQPLTLALAPAQIRWNYEATRCDGACATACPSMILGAPGTHDTFTPTLSGSELSLDGGAYGLPDACTGRPPKIFVFTRAPANTTCGKRWVQKPTAFDGAKILEGELKWSVDSLAAGEVRQLVMADDAALLSGDFTLTVKLHDFESG